MRTELHTERENVLHWNENMETVFHESAFVQPITQHMFINTQLITNTWRVVKQHSERGDLLMKENASTYASGIWDLA